MKVRFHEDAQDEFERARAWYAERNPTASNQFAREVLRVAEMIAEAPERWPFIGPNAHRVPIHRFPFTIIYEYSRHDSEILIIAVAHQSRQPDYWRDR